MSRVCVVVPCYNEAQRLDAGAFQRFLRAHDQVRFLFVDDGSRDATWERLQDLRKTAPSQVDALRLPTNQGKAEAVRQGMLAGLAGSAEYLGFWDADLATPLEVLPEFWSVLDRRPACEVVLGARVPLLGHAVLRNPLRRFLGRLLACLTWPALGFVPADTQCGAKLFRVTARTRSLFATQFQARWIFDIEVLARLRSLANSDLNSTFPWPHMLYELPLEMWQEKAGSKLRRRDFVIAFCDLLQITWTYGIRGWKNAVVADSAPRPSPTLRPTSRRATEPLKSSGT